MTVRRAFLAVSTLASLVGLTAGTPALAGLFGPDPPGVLTLSLYAGPDQNPDPSGHPSSVAIRLFMLADIGKFESADVFALTEHEQQTLGADEIGSEQFVLAPKETKTISRELKPGVRYIGIAVLFRDIDRAQWRAVSPVTASGPSRRALTINALNARLAGI